MKKFVSFFAVLFSFSAQADTDALGYLTFNNHLSLFGQNDGAAPMGMGWYCTIAANYQTWLGDNTALSGYLTGSYGFENNDNGMLETIELGNYITAEQTNTLFVGSPECPEGLYQVMPSGGAAASAQWLLGSSGTNLLFNTAGLILSGVPFIGNGAGLTSLNGASLSAGTVGIAQLAASSITINTGTGLSGGGTVALGGSITLSATGISTNSSPTFSGTVTALGGFESDGSGDFLAGVGNTANGSYATVGGGQANTASGLFATVPGGNLNVANGNYSLAAGQNAQATNQGSFVWSDDSSSSPFASTNNNSFNLRSFGGVRLVTGGTGMTIDGPVTASGVLLSSDRNAKENFTKLDSKSVLAKVASLPMTEWNYKDDSAGIRHVGPMAQDFHAAFGLDGSDDKHISVVDEGGVALAAIQGLNQKVEEREAKIREQDAEIKKLKERTTRVDMLEEQNDAMSMRLNELEAAVKFLAERK